MLQPSIEHQPAWSPIRPRQRGRMTDLLLQVARERSEEAFRKLFESFAPRIRSYMRRQGADAATAEELAQETLLTVWRKSALYSPEHGSPATWIFTIARNLRIDRLRREVNWIELSEARAETLPSEDVAPDENVALRQRQERVRAALGGMSPDQRQVVELAFIEGLSHSEIAARLDIPLGTVKSRMRLAYTKVRASLEDLQ